MKKFIIHISFIFLPLLVIPVLNYMVDPAHLFDNYEQELVSILQRNEYVINVSPNFNERKFKRTLIDSCKQDVDVLVLGSSRVMLLSEPMFDGQTLLNLGMSGATFEDISGILYHYLQKGKCPCQIIIGIDPQHFNASIGDARWLELQDDYAQFSRNILGEKYTPRPQLEKYKTLFSISYFHEAIKSFRSRKKSAGLEGVSLIAGKDIPCGVGLRKDGSYVYGRDMEMLSIAETNKQAKEESYEQWDGFTVISKYETQRWKRLMGYIKEHNIDICLYKVPYHPIMYHRLVSDEKYEMMAQAMVYADQLAKDANVRIVGSYNPDDFNFAHEDFYDGMHVRKCALERIKNIFNE